MVDKLRHLRRVGAGCSVFLLQETHRGTEEEAMDLEMMWRNMTGGDAIATRRTRGTNAGRSGVAILTEAGTCLEGVFRDDEHGHFIAAVANIGKARVPVMCVYMPSDRKSWNQYVRWLPELVKVVAQRVDLSTAVIGGDWNVHLAVADATGQLRAIRNSNLAPS